MYNIAFHVACWHEYSSVFFSQILRVFIYLLKVSHKVFMSFLLHACNNASINFYKNKSSATELVNENIKH